jgi:hypothetical protein
MDKIASQIRMNLVSRSGGLEFESLGPLGLGGLEFESLIFRKGLGRGGLEFESLGPLGLEGLEFESLVLSLRDVGPKGALGLQTGSAPVGLA